MKGDNIIVCEDLKKNLTTLCVKQQLMWIRIKILLDLYGNIDVRAMKTL